MDFVAYIFYRVVTRIVEMLPLAVNFRAGQALGWLAWLAAAPYRRLVVANLRIAFAGEKGDAEIRRLARRHFQTLGANLLCATKTASMPDDAVLARLTFEGEELLEQAKAEGRGVIWAICHMGNWELFARISSRLGSNLGTVYQPLANRYIDAHVKRTRGVSGVEPFARSEGFAGPVRLLRAGGHVGVLIDQHAGDTGVWTPLFGRLASTSPLAATLAVRTGAAMLSAAIFTEGPARWRVVISARLSPARDVGASTAEMNAALERQVRRSPQDWFWVHDRWKTPSPRFLLARYKRGIAFPEGFDPATLKPFRILVRSSNWLGDAVMSIPAVRAIKAGRPDAHVTVLTQEKLADLWKSVAEVDAVITIGKRDGLLAVARKIAGRFDAAVLLTNSLRTALETWLARVPHRVGREGHSRSALLSDIVKMPRLKDRPSPHHTQQFLAIARHVGAAVDADALPLFPARKKQPGARLVLGLCPGAEYGPAKRWPAERFAAAAGKITRQTGGEWLLFGVAADAPLTAQIAAALGAGCADLAGKTTLASLIEQLSRCDLLLTNDTGTMHLAAFLGVPVVAIFGSTEPSLTGPPGENVRIVRRHVECSPCFLRECPIDFRCMNELPVERVVAAALDLLGKSAAGER